MIMKKLQNNTGRKHYKNKSQEPAHHKLIANSTILWICTMDEMNLFGQR